MLHAVIMAGGSGTRFWPLSRTETPKQLLKLAGERTMIQQALDRCAELVPTENVWVVTNERQIAATREQLPELPTRNFLVEPVARNTAPCIGLAAFHLLQSDPEATMLVMPADHVIGPVPMFHAAVQTACQLVAEQPEMFSLFGVVPYFPSTGYGYIERSGPLASAGPHVFAVKSFREKPDLATAGDYLKRGTFFWNCGIFVWRAATILQALQRYEPDIYAPLKRISAAIGSPEEQQTLAEQFPLCPSISIDYAVLERAEQIAVVEALFDWDDVGSWQALHRLEGTDAIGNTVVGSHLGVDTQQCIVRSSGEHLIATLGMRNCIIVHTPDVTLVADKQDENSIKLLIEELRRQGLDHLL